MGHSLSGNPRSFRLCMIRSVSDFLCDDGLFQRAGMGCCLCRLSFPCCQRGACETIYVKWNQKNS